MPHESAPASSATRVTARRRQRSTRLTVAVTLLVLAALVVTGAVLSGSWLLVTLAAFAGVVLGAAATRITHTELAQARRDAARDRAEQAQAYRRLTEERSAEHASYVSTMAERIAERESALAELQDALGVAQRRAADATRKMNAEARRADIAEREGERVASRLDEAERTAAEAVVLVAELEQQVDVLRAELESVTAAWRTAEAGRRRA
jgi:uncharacterized membrane-anchored protein YhcB (DUF1043 family)